MPPSNITKGRLHLTVLAQEWQRPKTRGDCEDGPRPCPWVSCRHHLALDVTLRGDLHKSWPFDESNAEAVADALLDRKATCSLDVAEQGDHTAAEVGTFLNVTRQRIEAIEHVAHRRARHVRQAGVARAEWRQLLTRR
jgi:hypothetical protein